MTLDWYEDNGKQCSSDKYRNASQVILTDV